jgi:hypothetical protein
VEPVADRKESFRVLIIGGHDTFPFDKFRLSPDQESLRAFDDPVPILMPFLERSKGDRLTDFSPLDGDQGFVDRIISSLGYQAFGTD